MCVCWAGRTTSKLSSFPAPDTPGSQDKNVLRVNTRQNCTPVGTCSTVARSLLSRVRPPTAICFEAPTRNAVATLFVMVKSSSPSESMTWSDTPDLSCPAFTRDSSFCNTPRRKSV